MIFLKMTKIIKEIASSKCIIERISLPRAFNDYQYTYHVVLIITKKFHHFHVPLHEKVAASHYMGGLAL
jgi:hypothetical protein